jgi:hypothetical protein
MVLSSREGNTSCCNGLMQEIGLLNYCFLKGKSAPVEKTEGFGSTGKCVLWQMKVNDQRPKLKLQVNGGEIEGLVDTRADLSFPQILEFRMATSECLYKVYRNWKMISNKTKCTMG